jgi:hypothetical protein
MEKEYTAIFVDIVIELVQDLPREVIKRVYDAAYKEDISGIDTFRDWIYDWAGALESFYRLEGDDPCAWTYDIVDTCECVADMMACATLKDDYFEFDFSSTDSGLAVPTNDELRKALEKRHKHMKKENVTYTELLYNKLKKKKKK